MQSLSHFHVIWIVILFSVGPIGCDGIAGSQRRLDRCGVCGGDNSTCRVVSGIFTRPQLPVGYNLVAHIPTGACNLNITQVKRSPNYLALKNMDGTYILNGDWRLSWPGEYDGAGAKFHYSRQTFNSLESIVSRGPLKEPVDLMVLSQRKNPGIKYEYMMPLKDVPIPPALPGSSGRFHSYSAATSRPFALANNLVLGSQTGKDQYSPYRNSFNSISSFPNTDDNRSSSHIFKHNTLPSAHRHMHSSNRGRRHRNSNALNGHPGSKKFFWKTVAYTNCTEPCGGGTQMSIVRCVRASNLNPVADRRCANEEKPLSQTVRCNVKSCPAKWVIGAWSSCSESCGEGVQKRSLRCEQRISPTLTMQVAEGACLDPKPESKKSCIIRPCHKWHTTDWTQCSAPCGNGIRRRIVTCRDGSGKSVDTQHCQHEEKLVEISPCNMGPCEGVEWFTSQWSTCDQDCGTGLQTRHVVCSALDKNKRHQNQFRKNSRELETNVIDDGGGYLNDDSGSSDGLYCDVGKKPPSTRECFSERQCNEPVWYTGPWSSCSASCSDGYKSRQVLCVMYSRGKFRVVDSSRCELNERPEDKVVCHSEITCPTRWFTSEWGQCTNGIEKRSISCRDSNWTQVSYYCSDHERPSERRSCYEEPQPEPTISKDEVNVNSIENERISTETRNTSNNVQNGSSRFASSDTAVEDTQYLEPNEEPDDSKCEDEYRNCRLVVQARLCRYKYYRSACCSSCSEL